MSWIIRLICSRWLRECRNRSKWRRVMRIKWANHHTNQNPQASQKLHGKIPNLTAMCWTTTSTKLSSFSKIISRISRSQAAPQTKGARLQLMWGRYQAGNPCILRAHKRSLQASISIIKMPTLCMTAWSKDSLQIKIEARVFRNSGTAPKPTCKDHPYPPSRSRSSDSNPSSSRIINALAARWCRGRWLRVGNPINRITTNKKVISRKFQI